MESKRCSLCREEKPLSAFSRNRKSRDGYNAACTQCKKARAGTGKPHRPKLNLPEGFKQCSKCGEIKEVSEFHRASSSKDGWRSQCKLCVAEAAGWSYRPKEHLPEGQKRCTTCKQIMPATSEWFKVQKKSPDGLGTICKACAAAYSRQYHRDNLDKRHIYNKRRYWSNRDEERAKSRKWYQQNKQRHRAAAKAWHEANRDHVRAMERKRYLAKREQYVEKTRRWRVENQDRYRAYNRKWAEENPEKVNAIMKAKDTRRRARIRSLPYTFTTNQWELCLSYWGNKCAVCESNEVIHADHWIPLINPKSPGTIAENMICLCGKCNRTKQARDAKVWLIDKLGEQAAMQKLAEIEAYFEYVRILGQKDEG